MAVVVEVGALEGAAALEAALARLVGKEQKKAYRGAMRPAMKHVLTEAVSLAPVRSGRLKRSLKLRATRRSRRIIGVRVMTGSREQLQIPASAKGYYPTALERGWKHRGGGQVPARPYLGPALDRKREMVFDTFGRELFVRIDQIWSRR